MHCWFRLLPECCLSTIMPCACIAPVFNRLPGPLTTWFALAACSPQCVLVCCFRVAVCRVPAYYALILRSLTVLEGLALQADPQYKLLGRAYPYIARRLLTDPAPELRASFEELILKVGGGAGGRGNTCSVVWGDGLRRSSCLHQQLSAQPGLC